MERTITVGLKTEGSVKVSLVNGPRHIVDHRKTADGLQKMIIWPTNKHKVTQFWFELYIMHDFIFLWARKCEQKMVFELM